VAAPLLPKYIIGIPCWNCLLLLQHLALTFTTTDLDIKRGATPVAPPHKAMDPGPRRDKKENGAAGRYCQEVHKVGKFSWRI
jgi:hypothetical protein